MRMIEPHDLRVGVAKTHGFKSWRHVAHMAMRIYIKAWTTSKKLFRTHEDYTCYGSHTGQRTYRLHAHTVLSAAASRAQRLSHGFA